jgi:hypothetical protein
MGLLPLPVSDWIEIDEAFTSQLSTKRELIQSRHSDVFQALPEALPASQELLRMLAHHLPKHHPDVFAFERGHFCNRRTAEVWNFERNELHPLDQAGRLIQEDLCIMQHDGRDYCLTGGAVCFPAHWCLADKIGRPVTMIHELVPGYADLLAAAVDRFLERLQVGMLLWRSNWVLQDDSTLFQIGREPFERSIADQDIGEELWLRVERQTLQRLPQSGSVLFTIRTHVNRLVSVLGTRKLVTDLASSIRSMSTATVEYRQMAHIASPLLAWLDRRAERLEG